MTLLGDNLYSHQPMCEEVLAVQWNYIFTCLPQSHPTLYEGLDSLERLGAVKLFEVEYHHLKTHHLYQYRYAYQVPLRDEASENSGVSLSVNQTFPTFFTSLKKVIATLISSDN